MSSAATQTSVPTRANMVVRPRGQGHEAMAYLVHLRAWRRAAGLTQFELSWLSHVVVSTISRIENHPLDHPVHFGLVHRLGQALGIANHVLIEQAPPEKLPDNWALGHTIRVTEEEGDLRFRMPLLYLRVGGEGQLTFDELAARTRINPDDLDAMCAGHMGATADQLQCIAAVLGMRQMDLITRMV